MAAAGGAASLTAAPVASAVSPADCKLKDFGPREVVIGAGWSGVAKFELKTTCPVESDVNWYLTVQNDPPGPFGWLLRANHYQPPSSRYSSASPCIHSGRPCANSARLIFPTSPRRSFVDRPS